MRRRLLINNGDGISEGVAYSGTLEVTELTYEDVFFDCPGTTHFAIMMNEEPSLDTENAFFAGVISNKQYVIGTYSLQAGNSVSIGNVRNNNESNNTYPICVFSEHGITMKINTGGYDQYKRWFQAGKSYVWIAW